MMRRSAVFLIAVLLGAALIVPVSAASLFPLDSGSMFTDRKARGVGDLVTVIIVEQAQARQKR